MSANTLERQVMRKVALRLLPFMAICYVAAYLDRANVAFAKLTMLSDLQLSTAMYATGAGIFFLGYFLFELPSNLFLERFGARRWIARIMVTWGIISSAMMFVRGEWDFYILRFLLGIAEAGFFPGMILYITYWFPRSYRARTVAMFMSAGAFSFVIGGPLSGWLLDHPQYGLKSWQWLFLMEGIPSVVLGIAVMLLLTNGPHEAAWLRPEERDWLTGVLDRERAEQEQQRHFSLREALSSGKVMLLSGIYFLFVIGGYGMDFFLPTLLQRAYPALTKSELGWLAAIPPLLAVPAMILHGRHADRVGERRWHVACAAAWSALGFVILSLPVSPIWIIVGAVLCVTGRWSLLGPFWGISTALLTGSAAAGGIAMINSIGNLGGQAGPSILAALQTSDGGFEIGLRVLAGIVLAGGAATVAFLAPERKKSEGAQVPIPGEVLDM
jgi:ACS family tartrate transporter-like MFS transporter